MSLNADNGNHQAQQYLNALEEHPNDKKALKEAAFYFLNIGNYTEAEKYAHRLLELGKSENDRDFCELYGRIVLGASKFDKDPTECFGQLEEARLIALKTNNQDALLSINNSLGMYYLLSHNDVYTATTYYYEALENAKEINDQRRYGIILSNLSGAYLMMNDISGQKLAEQSHEIAVKRGEDIPLYYAKLALAQFYLLSNNDIDKIEKLVGEIENLQNKGDYEGKPNLYLLKGRLAERKGDFAEAYQNYHLAMEHSDNSDVSELQAINLAYARLLRRDNKIREAIKVLEARLKTNQATEMKIYLPEIVKELVYNYKEIGDYRKSLDYSLIYQAGLDSIFNLSRERALQENRIRHEIYANEKLIDEQRLELLSSRHKLTLLAVSIIAILALLILTYINYRKKDKLYRAIVSQNREYLAREQILREQIDNSKSGVAQADVSHTLHSNRSDDLFARFTALMMEKKVFCDPSITVGGVAEMLGTNRTYLSRAINESMQKTFTQVVNDYRIKEAIALISDLKTNRPLKQICSDVGFSAVSTFYSSFQNITGMTPARYRAQLMDMDQSDSKDGVLD